MTKYYLLIFVYSKYIFSKVFIGIFSLLLLSGCSFSAGLNMESRKNLENIDRKIAELTNGHPITYLKMMSEINSTDLKTINLIAVDTINLVKYTVKYNVYEDILKCDTSAVSSKYRLIENPRISDIYPFIGKCEELIPEGYRYSHIRSVVFEKGDGKVMTIKLEKEDNDKAYANKNIRKEKHKEYIYTYNGRGRISGKKPVEKYYYTIKFRVDNDQLIII